MKISDRNDFFFFFKLKLQATNSLALWLGCRAKETLREW